MSTTFKQPMTIATGLKATPRKSLIGVTRNCGRYLLRSICQFQVPTSGFPTAEERQRSSTRNVGTDGDPEPRPVSVSGAIVTRDTVASVASSGAQRWMVIVSEVGDVAGFAVIPVLWGYGVGDV